MLPPSKSDNNNAPQSCRYSKNKGGIANSNHTFIESVGSINENLFLKSHFQIDETTTTTVLHDRTTINNINNDDGDHSKRTVSSFPAVVAKSISDNILSLRNFLRRELKPIVSSLHQAHSYSDPEPDTMPQTTNQYMADMSNEIVICRICQVENSTDDRLVHLCNCKGSLANYHFECLTTWLSLSHRTACELCNFKFDISYKLLPLNKWKWKAFPKAPILWLMICLMVIALNIGLVVMETRRTCVNNNCVFLYMMSVIGSLITLALLLVWVKVFIDEFSKWMKLNHELLITDPQTGRFFNANSIK